MSVANNNNEIAEFVEFLAKLDGSSIEDAYGYVEEDYIEIISDEDLELPSGIKFFEKLSSIFIAAPITTLARELSEIEALECIDIKNTKLLNFKQIHHDFFEKQNLEIIFNPKVYKNSPWEIGKGVFGFREGDLIFTSKENDLITIPTFIHDGYGLYLGSGEISVKDFKKVIMNELDLEGAESFSSNGIYGDGDLIADTYYAANDAVHWSFHGKRPTHFIK